MIHVHVHLQVLPEGLEEFLDETRRNAEASAQEPGVHRFDVLQDEADPAHVVLDEAYLDQAAADSHKETAHFARWAECAPRLLAEPWTRTLFRAVGSEGASPL